MLTRTRRPASKLLTVATVSCMVALPCSARADDVKNIIILVGDGAGYNTFEATRLWTGDELAQDDPTWIKLPMATYSLRFSPAEPVPGPAGLVQDPAAVYDPAKAWDTASQSGSSSGYSYNFKGYKWHRDTFPDSANTMSAMMTGVTTYNKAINVNGNGDPLYAVSQAAKALGKSTGSVSSVPFNHATGAAGCGAHNIDRNNLHELAQEMFSAGVMDVIGGGGHPWYDNDGELLDEPDDNWIDMDTWNALAAGSLASNDGPNWTLVEDKAAIEALAAGPTPAKLAIIPRAGDTLQQSRDSADDPQDTEPGDDPYIPTIPTLKAMAMAALNVLDDNPNGFFLHVEGGAIDWAMHGNQLGRMIEEHMAFQDVVEAITHYLNANTNGNNWSNTLVIVTADHDHMLFGPDSSNIPFQNLEDNGAGELPGHKWQANSHSNQLVPLFARGFNADALTSYADQIDAYDDGTYQFGRGAYLHQSELGIMLLDLLNACPADITGSSVPADGQVDVFDLTFLLTHWNSGADGAELAPPDDVIDVFDLLQLLSAWGSCQ